MRKFLPSSTKNSQGFTLVELLVVVAIIAVLSVIGITIYGGVQKNARDARRRADIDAISTALEAHYNDTGCGATAVAPYCPVTAATAPTLFASSDIPANPTPGGANYTGLPTVAVATYNVCATLETPIGTQFCKRNQQ